MAAFDSEAFLLSDAFDGEAFDFAGGAAATVSDGGGMWPPRLNDPRWVDFMTAQGITPSRGGIGNDVREALANSLGMTATQANKWQLDSLWKKYLLSVGKKNISSEDSFP